MIEVPAGLLGFPIGGEGLRSPFDDAVVDGDGTEQGKDIHQGLDGEANSGEAPCEAGEMPEGKDKRKVEQRGTDHPERHDAPKECGH